MLCKMDFITVASGGGSLVKAVVLVAVGEAKSGPSNLPLYCRQAFRQRMWRARGGVAKGDW